MTTPESADLGDVQVPFRDVLDDVKATVAADYMQARIDLAVERATVRALRAQVTAAREREAAVERERANHVGVLAERDALIADLRAQVDVLVERVRAQDAQQVDAARTPDEERAPSAA